MSALLYITGLQNALMGKGALIVQSIHILSEYSIRVRLVMKSGIRLLVAAMCLSVVTALPSAAQAQSESVSPALQDAIQRGDINALTSLSADRLEVTLFGAASMYSRGQAMYVLADFFRQYPPQRVRFGDGSRSGANWFLMGEYYFEGGDQPLRIFVRLRTKDGRSELRELRIDRRSGS